MDTTTFPLHHQNTDHDNDENVVVVDDDDDDMDDFSVPQFHDTVSSSSSLHRTMNTTIDTPLVGGDICDVSSIGHVSLEQSMASSTI